MGFSDQQYNPQNQLYTNFGSFGKQKGFKVLRKTKSTFKEGATNFVY